MQDNLNTPIAKSEVGFQEPETILKISITLPSSSQNYIEVLEGPDRSETHVQKLDYLRQKPARFAKDVKFWPIFDTEVLHKYSFVYYYYFQLSFFVLKLLIIMTVLTIIYYIVDTVLEAHEENVARMWLFFGYGILTIVIIRLFCIREEKKIIKARDSQREDWTENKFALLVDKLPLLATKQDIKKFFEEKIQENGFNDTIKEIMLLQDCGRYLHLDKKVRKENYARRKTIGTKLSLIKTIVKLKDERAEILNSANVYGLYKGKAIIIFETIRGKITIENYFHINGLRKLFYQLFPNWFGKRYCLFGKLPSVKEAPEPTDLIFENLYVPKSKIRWRKYLTYFLGNLAVLVGIGIDVITKIVEAGYDPDHWPTFSFFIYSAVIVGATLVIYLFIDILLEKLIIHRKESECELEKVKYRINISYLSLNVYLIVLVYFIPSVQIFEEQLLVTILLLAALVPLRKIVSVISIKKIRLRRRLYREPALMEKYSEEEIIEIFTNPEFDFADNLEDIVCFIFITLGFYALGKIYFVIISLGGFVMSICIDKWVLIHLTSPTKIKGSEMGLEFFRIFRWDVRLQLLTIAFLPTEMAFQVTAMPPVLKIVLYVFYGIFLLWDFRSSVRKSWKHKWSKERENTKYDDVSTFFPHTYKDEYPFEVY